MDLHLEGKRTLVTGSTAGIGFAAALGLAREGADVIVNGRTEARAQAAAQRIREQVPGATVRSVAADLAGAEGCDALIQAVPDLDVLVDNVGIFEPKPFEEIADADWLRFFETNVMSGVRLSRHYLKGMRERDWGRIVFVSSESGLQIPPEMIHYGMTKTAQLAIARGIAETTAGTGVTVNSVLPGPTRSEGVATFVDRMAQQRGIDFATMEREFFETARPSSLLRRFASVEEVASMIVYVCSAAASATNGAALRVDGGVVRAILWRPEPAAQISGSRRESCPRRGLPWAGIDLDLALGRLQLPVHRTAITTRASRRGRQRLCAVCLLTPGDQDPPQFIAHRRRALGTHKRPCCKVASIVALRVPTVVGLHFLLLFPGSSLAKEGLQTGRPHANLESYKPSCGAVGG